MRSFMSGSSRKRPSKKAELRALQAQITPHFMYNTLETIVWLAEEGRNSEVVEMTMAFTGFLRISLSRGAGLHHGRARGTARCKLSADSVGAVR